ncbi:MAG TPA: hypothetical protein VGB42_00675 [Candidatus Thermoplasmatota archaeon]
MSRWTKSVEVARPPQTVWETPVDYPNVPKRAAKVSAMSVDRPGPAAVGTKVTIRARGGGSHVEHAHALSIKGVAKLFGPLIGSGVKKELRMLKNQVQGGAT